MITRNLLSLSVLLALFWIKDCIARGGNTLTLVNSDGAIRSSSQLAGYGGEGAQRSIIAVLDTTGGSCLQLLKSCLQIDINIESSNCISMCTTKDKAVLYAVYQQMNGAKYCGSRAAEYCSSVAHKIVVALPAQDLSDTLRGHEQVLRKLANQMTSESNLKSVIFLVDTTNAPSSSIETISADVQTLFRDVYSDITGKVIDDFNLPKNAN